MRNLTPLPLSLPPLLSLSVISTPPLFLEEEEDEEEAEEEEEEEEEEGEFGSRYWSLFYSLYG